MAFAAAGNKSTGAGNKLSQLSHSVSFIVATQHDRCYHRHVSHSLPLQKQQMVLFRCWHQHLFYSSLAAGVNLVSLRCWHQHLSYSSLAAGVNCFAIDSIDYHVFSAISRMAQYNWWARAIGLCRCSACLYFWVFILSASAFSLKFTH